jgi:hypothetical protein
MTIYKPRRKISGETIPFNNLMFWNDGKINVCYYMTALRSSNGILGDTLIFSAVTI